MKSRRRIERHPPTPLPTRTAPRGDAACDRSRRGPPSPCSFGPHLREAAGAGHVARVAPGADLPCGPGAAAFVGPGPRRGRRGGRDTPRSRTPACRPPFRASRHVRVDPSHAARPANATGCTRFSASRRHDSGRRRRSPPARRGPSGRRTPRCRPRTARRLERGGFVPEEIPHGRHLPNGRVAFSPLDAAGDGA